MHKAAIHAEGLDGAAAQRPERLRNLRAGVVHQVHIPIDDVHHRRPDRHALKQGHAPGIEDGVIGANVAFDEFLHHIGNAGQVGIERFKVAVVFQLPGVGRTHADVRLDDHRIAHLADKRVSGFGVGHHVLAGGGNAGLAIDPLHGGLVLDDADPVAADARGHVEILTQPGILLQPVFIHGFDPVHLAVLECEEGNGPIDLVVVLQAVHPIVFRQRRLQRRFKTVVGRVADAQHIDAIAAQSIAELPVGVGKVRRYKDEIHDLASCITSRR